MFYPYIEQICVIHDAEGWREKKIDNINLEIPQSNKGNIVLHHNNGAITENKSEMTIQQEQFTQKCKGVEM